MTPLFVTDLAALRVRDLRAEAAVGQEPPGRPPVTGRGRQA